jgi:hypothetical protein
MTQAEREEHDRAVARIIALFERKEQLFQAEQRRKYREREAKELGLHRSSKSLRK